MGNEEPQPQARRRKIHYAWFTVAVLGLVMAASSGVRNSFGVFIQPLEQEFGWTRTTLSIVASLSLFLYGAVGPLVGRLADRWGPRGVLAIAVALLSAGTLASAAINSLWQFFLAAGIVSALGAGGAALSVAASVAARWFDTRRGLVMGIAGAGVATGQLLITPLLMAITVSWGWRSAYVALSLGLLVFVLPLALGVIRNDPKELGLQPYGAGSTTGRTTATPSRSSERTSIGRAMRTLPFWLLAGSFTVCGYTTSGLVLTHLIPHASDLGFHAAHAAEALGIMGAFNIVGTLGSGWICDRFGEKLPLAGYYILRGSTLIFLPYLHTTPALFAFAAMYGLNYISTVPATTSLTAKIFGRYSVGELSGWIFVFHQLGAAFGSVFGGYAHDLFHSYSLAFHSAAALAFIASAMVLAIPENPLTQIPPMTTPLVSNQQIIGNQP